MHRIYFTRGANQFGSLCLCEVLQNEDDLKVDLVNVLLEPVVTNVRMLMRHTAMARSLP